MSLRAVLHLFVSKAANAWHRIIKTRCWYALFFQHIGTGSSLRNPIFLFNPHRISLGERVYIMDGARLETHGGGCLVIGDDCAFGQNLTITSGGRLAIGKNCLVSFDVMLTDIDHSYDALDIPVIKQNNIIKLTSIGDYCFIGSGVKITAGTVLGRQCAVGANSVVRGTFPDYCVIVGAPARIVKRYNPVTSRWEKRMWRAIFFLLLLSDWRVS